LKNRYFTKPCLLLLIVFAPLLASAQDIYSNLSLPTDSLFLSDRQYITDLLRKERYLNLLATNIELITNEAKRFPVRYKFTPQEERTILSDIDKKLKQTADVDSLEKVYTRLQKQLDSSRKAFDQLDRATPKKSKEELDRDPVAKANAERLKLAEEEVKAIEELATETKKLLDKLRSKREVTREAIERYMFEGKKTIGAPSARLLSSQYSGFRLSRK
jgi:NAD-dependent DNA ligase